MIRHIEELSMNAWPALQTLLYDGWVLRFADGYTRRANSVNPLYLSAVSVEEKIQTCEQIYRGKGLPTIFKMTSAVHPENLDAILDQCGYQIDSQTSVQTLDLIHASIQDAELNNALTEEWLASFCRMNNVAEERRSVIRQMLGNIIPQKCFAAIRQHGQTIACGMGVVQDGFLGLFDIVTDANFRNRGYGRQLVLDLLTWGKNHGARNAYLQVMLNNPPALRLYSNIGFESSYQYWYRVKT